MVADLQVTKALRTMRVLGFAMVGAVVVFTVVVAFLLQLEVLPSGNPQLEILGLLAAALAMVNFFLSFVIPSLLARRAAAAADPINAAQLEQRLDDPGIAGRLARFQATTLLRIALNEGAALFGAVAVLVTGTWMPAGLAIVIGVLGAALAIPSYATVEQALAQEPAR